jgi:phage-related tail protein
MSIEEFKQWVEEKRAIYTQQALDEQRNQQALAQLKTNHAIDEGLLRDHYVTLEEIDEDYVQFQNETGKDSYEQFEEWERKKLEARKRTNAQMSEDDKQIAGATISIAQQAFDTIFSIQATNRQARLDTDLQALEKAKDKELQNKNLTEEQKDAINKRYAAEEAKLKRRAYEQDKQAKLAQAAINGALAITNILATRPKSDFGVGDAIMIASAIASTAAQIALITSTPVPQFARGGKNIPAGMKLVGEQGPELIWTPGGETVIPHGDTAKILEAWSIPLPNVNPALKTDMAIAAALPAGINYNKLAAVLAQELRNNPSVNISMDNAGFAMHLLQKNKSVQLLNNRYSA